MTLEFPGHRAPDGGFDVPLDMLSACHHRIERQCATLRRLLDHLPRWGADGDAQSAARAVLRYFDTAAVHHHEDEEVDLFPALIAAAGAGERTDVRALTEALRTDHRALEACWLRLRGPLGRIAQGSASTLPASDVHALVESYERHLALEDRALLPLAARLLDQDALDAVGRAMCRRRGLDKVD